MGPFGLLVTKSVPGFRAQNWARFSTQNSVFRQPCVQAVATWRWSSFVRAHCPSGKHRVYINMDETCIRMCPENRAGLVYVKRGAEKKHVLEHEQKATLSMRRSACSLVAFTSSCHEVGRLLPQVILINQRILTESEVRLIRDELSSRPNCYLLGRRSAWVMGRFWLRSSA